MQMVKDLQLQLAGEMNKRMEVQKRLLEKDQRLREAQKLAEDRGGDAVYGDVQDRLAEEESRRQQLEGELMEKDFQLREMQQQLADELNQRMAVQNQVVEKEQQLREMESAIEEEDFCKQRETRGQVIQKEREVCELQNQLAEELSKRQTVQYEVIEKERVICHLQQQLLTLSSMRADRGNSRYHGSPMASEPHRLLDLAPQEEVFEEGNEDTEDQPVPSSASTLDKAASGAGVTPKASFVTSPRVPPTPGANRMMSFQPMQQPPPQRGIVPTGGGVSLEVPPRGPGGVSLEVPPRGPAAGVPPSGHAMASTFVRSRMYVPRGSVPDTAWRNMFSKAQQGRRHDAGASPPPSSMEDRIQRRLALGSRTFA